MGTSRAVASVLAASALILAAGCSSESGDANPVSDTPATAPTPPPTSPLPAKGTVGRIGVAFTLAGDLGITSVTWTITGPSGASTVVDSGVVPVNANQSTSFLVGLGAGSGYALTIVAISPDGGTACNGSTNFNIAAGATTNVTVDVQCIVAHAHVQTDAGDAQAPSDAQAPNCPSWTSVTATPSETTVGSSLTLSTTATAADPSAIAYTWSANSGTIATPTMATTQFTCTAPGQVPVTLSLGNVSADGTDVLCSAPTATTTITVLCDNAGSVAPAPAMPPWATLLLGSGLASVAAAATRRARNRGEFESRIAPGGSL